jgi:Glycosyltransferase 61
MKRLIKLIIDKVFRILFYLYAGWDKQLFVVRKIYTYFQKDFAGYYKVTHLSSEVDKSILSTSAMLASQTWATQNLSFYNFDPSACISNIKVFQGTPIAETRTLNDVIYHPKYQAFYFSDGSLVDYSWSPLWGSQFPEGTPSKIDPPRGLKKVDRKFMHGGLISGHYGHFLTDCISRLWYAFKDYELPILCQGYFQPHIKRNFLDYFLNSINLDRERFISFQKPIQFREIVIPHPTFRSSTEIFSTHKFLPEAVAADLLPEKTKKTEQPLYFSRRKLTKNNSFRSIQNEDKLEKILRSKNFAIAYPEYLSLEEQIHLINKHEVLIGVCGSALHSVLFDLSSSINLVCLTDNTFSNNNFILIDAIKRSKSAYINSIELYLEPGKDIHKDIWRRNRVINLDIASSSLKELGIL